MSSEQLPVSPSGRLSRIVMAVVVVTLTALALLLSRSATGAAQPARLPVEPLVAPPTDQIIVRFHDSANQGALSAAAEAQLAERLSAAAGVSLAVQRPMSGGATVLKLAERADEATATAISQRLAALPEVEYAEPDAIMQLVGRPVVVEAPHSADLTPNDPRFSDQWHYRYQAGVAEGLNLVPAWNITTGSASTVVAVIDTGIRSHPDLAGRTVPGYDFITDPFVANDGDGRDNNPADPGDWSTSNQCFPGSPSEDSSWHGTHVAGTIGANSNNNSGVAGVNWATRILPVRVLGRCGGYLSDIVDATRWAGGLAVPGAPANANPADVINLSLGGSGACGVSYQDAFDDLIAAGVVSVVAAGNSAVNASGARPANCDGVITVAATSKTGDQAYYTNFGTVVEIAAPGGEQSFANDPDGVLSTLNAGTTVPAGDNYIYYQGTSMAAPHVAGLVSLMMGEQPSLTPAQVLNILQTTARDFPGGSGCTTAKCGAGIADAFAALSALDVELVAPTLISPANGANVGTLTPTLSWSAVAGADAYQVQVSSNAAFSNIVVNLPSVAGTTTSVSLPDEGSYWWRVRAKAGADTGPWSAEWRMNLTDGGGPVASKSFLPMTTNVPYVPPAQPLVNGDFEQGPAGWGQSSSKGVRIILHISEEEYMVVHGGEWGAWLGGLNNETSVISQEVTVPTNQPYLAFYYRINSADVCGFDYGRVFINTQVVKSYNLCQSNNMGNFGRNVINLTTYAGQTVTLKFQSTSNGSGISNLFVDDVSFVNSAAAETPGVSAPDSSERIFQK